jgi:hypothetical protein
MAQRILLWPEVRRIALAAAQLRSAVVGALTLVSTDTMIVAFLSVHPPRVCPAVGCE